jgi:Holliday junction resolvase RusA-like endonuclease
MAELVIAVRGIPAPQGSKSRDRFGNMFESSRKVEPWRKAVASAVWQARANRNLTGPLAVDATFYVARPARHYGTGRNASVLRGDAPAVPSAKPDVDKYARGLLDALQIAGVFGDDGQVADLHCRKRYAEVGTLPGALVRIEQMRAL